MTSPALRWGKTATRRAIDRLARETADLLRPRIDQLEHAGVRRLEHAAALAEAGAAQGLAIRRQLFYAALTELARRHSGEVTLPLGPDLTRFELSLYSQNGEDGVIAEMLRRIGPGRREFVEFGAERGLEGNCVALADVFGWQGLFIEGDEAKAAALAWKYRGNERVRTLRARVTADNIDQLLTTGGVSDEPDVLSIDTDGNDLWIWRAITVARPRVVIVEYNAHLDFTRPLTIPYDPEWVWAGTDWFGASLAGLGVVAEEKGYRLVHTELNGVNAFFVRDDLAVQFDDIDHSPQRSTNYFGRGGGHPAHPSPAEYVDPRASTD